MYESRVIYPKDCKGELNKMEAGGWELVAITTLSTGMALFVFHKVGNALKAEPKATVTSNELTGK